MLQFLISFIHLPLEFYIFILSFGRISLFLFRFYSFLSITHLFVLETGVSKNTKTRINVPGKVLFIIAQTEKILNTFQPKFE